MTKRVAVGVAWAIFIAAGPCQAEGLLPNTVECPPLSLAPLALPPGVSGTPYSYRIPTYGGHQPVSITLASGALPPGVVISAAGEITGEPKASGTFDFALIAVDSCPTVRQRVTRPQKLIVLPDKDQQASASVMRQRHLKLKVTANPAVVPLVSGKPVEQELSYGIAAEPAETVTLHSPGGTFSVAGSVIESVPVPLTVAVVNGKAVLSEKVTVSERVLEAARRGKAKIIYSRPFSGRQTTDLAVVDFTVH